MLVQLSMTRLDEITRDASDPAVLRYLRPDFAVQTLWNEVVDRWGIRAQNKGLFAGQEPELFGCDAHNLDAQGICHALDLGVESDGDGAGLSRSDALWLAEYLRTVGAKSDRFAYLMHRGQIAGQFSGWKWLDYFGSNSGTDRIHISICDQPWGAPPSLGVDVFDSMRGWGIR